MRGGQVKIRIQLQPAGGAGGKQVMACVAPLDLLEPRLGKILNRLRRSLVKRRAQIAAARCLDAHAADSDGKLLLGPRFEEPHRAREKIGEIGRRLRPGRRRKIIRRDARPYVPAGLVRLDRACAHRQFQSIGIKDRVHGQVDPVANRPAGKPPEKPGPKRKLAATVVKKAPGGGKLNDSRRIAGVHRREQAHVDQRSAGSEVFRRRRLLAGDRPDGVWRDDVRRGIAVAQQLDRRRNAAGSLPIGRCGIGCLGPSGCCRRKCGRKLGVLGSRGCAVGRAGQGFINGVERFRSLCCCRQASPPAFPTMAGETPALLYLCDSSGHPMRMAWRPPPPAT